jgi:ABC-type Fe3+-hydroxamate transport system substrate-binding protein
VPPTGGEDPRSQPARTAALTGVISDAGGGGRRAFIDATGASVSLPPSIRRFVATDEVVGGLLSALGGDVVGCAGSLDGVAAVGEQRAPDLRAVAALKPDVIVTGAVERAHDLVDARLVAALRRVAPVIAVDTGRPAAAGADLRALLGRGTAAPSTAKPPRPRPPAPNRSPGSPSTTPDLF